MYPSLSKQALPLDTALLIEKDVIVEVPAYYEFMIPTLQALHKLDGNASINELADEVIAIMDLPPEMTEQPHGNSGHGEKLWHKVMDENVNGFFARSKSVCQA